MGIKVSRYFISVFFILVIPVQAYSGKGFLIPADSLDNVRRNSVFAGYTLGMTAGYAGLYHLWYSRKGFADFRFHNDSRQWLQMDKAGHMMSAYQIGEYGIRSLRWAGVDERRAVWQGGAAGLLFLTGIEIFDGFSPGYGFSWGDKAANVLGTAMLVSQEMLWQEQRFRIKFSYTPSPYTGYRPELLGRNLRESWLKDYNGQTYWLSFSPGSFDEGGFIPDWLCFSLGYSGGGMTGGSYNPEFNGAGEWLPEFTRHRQYFISLDLDLTRLEPRSRLLRTLFSAFGFVKIPFPALEYNSMDGLRLRPFYF